MAFITGTATGWADFYNILRDFLTTGMTPIGERWTQVYGTGGTLDATSEIVLRGPGLASDDQILVSIKPYIYTGADVYNIGFTGLSIFNEALGGPSAQVNKSPISVLHLWNDPIDYWIVANGRRFIAVARISTTYHAAYCGFGLPLSLPSQYPYPLFIGGSSDLVSERWSTPIPRLRNFYNPAYSANVMMPDVTWKQVSNVNENDTLRDTGMFMTPYRMDLQPMRENLDGGYTLQPVSIIGNQPYQAQLMRLQSVYRVSGFGNSAGSIVSSGGIDHIVIPNVYRSDWANFAAIGLE